MTPVPAPHAPLRALEAFQNRELMREIQRLYGPVFPGACVLSPAQQGKAQRALKHSDFEENTMHKNVIDMTGQQFGRLTVQSMAEGSSGRIAWLCLCSCGTVKSIDGTSLRRGLTRSCGCLVRETTSRIGAATKGRRIDQPTYSGAHKRIAYTRGPASEYDCAHCGNPARAWAYDHADPAELTGDDHGRAVHYSADPAHYLPLCDPCHRRFDYDQQ